MKYKPYCVRSSDEKKIPILTVYPLMSVSSIGKKDVVLQYLHSQIPLDCLKLVLSFLPPEHLVQYVIENPSYEAHIKAVIKKYHRTKRKDFAEKLSRQRFVMKDFKKYIVTESDERLCQQIYHAHPDLSGLSIAELNHYYENRIRGFLEYELQSHEHADVMLESILKHWLDFENPSFLRLVCSVRNWLLKYGFDEKDINSLRPEFLLTRAGLFCHENYPDYGLSAHTDKMPSGVSIGLDRAGYPILLFKFKESVDIVDKVTRQARAWTYLFSSPTLEDKFTFKDDVILLIKTRDKEVTGRIVNKIPTKTGSELQVALSLFDPDDDYAVKPVTKSMLTSYQLACLEKATPVGHVITIPVNRSTSITKSLSF